MSVLGVTLVGGEWAAPFVTFPTQKQIDYYGTTKGLKLIRIPIKWENFQPTLMGPLDPTFVANLKAVLGYIAATKSWAVIDLHNYGRWNNLTLGSTSVPITAFADVWSKLAAALKGLAYIYGYDLMNEPHDLPTAAVWPAAAQAATDAIRLVDAGVQVIIEGDGWSAAHSWQTYNGSLKINDPSNRLIYSAHSYWDHNRGGVYPYSYAVEKGTPTMALGPLYAGPFFDWIKANGFKGYFGEFGIPGRDAVSGAEWLVVMHNFLVACEAAGIDGTYWAGGQWNMIGLGGPDYSQPMEQISCEPIAGVDAPQTTMLVADDHKP
jgi:aryl-phospho-beta-D-glucosidase BglC (GH1 family)